MALSAHRGEILHFLSDTAADGEQAVEHFKDGILLIEDGYIKGSVETLLTKVKDAIISELDKNECKELFREKFAIDRLDKSGYTPMTHQDEIKILAPNFSLDDKDLLFYNPETLNEEWIGWRAIDIIENFIKPINQII